MRISWDSYFMLIAKTAALRSGCNSRPGGAIIVNPKTNRIVSTGMTGTIPKSEQCTDNGVDYCRRRALGFADAGNIKKYTICPSIHAEENALLMAQGDLKDFVMYCTLQPCPMCLKKIAAAGIHTVFFEHFYDSKNPYRDGEWLDLFDEYGVKGIPFVITEKVKEIAVNNIEHITSKRRLKATD